jgi:16S rRNA G966 N2-methylase RsmD
MKNLKFNIIIADPPYTEFKIEQIEELAVMLAEGGILIISSPASEEMPPTILSLNLTRQKKMAAAQLSFYS